MEWIEPAQPGSCDASVTPSPFTGARRASDRDGAVAEHSPTGIASVFVSLISLVFPPCLRVAVWVPSLPPTKDLEDDAVVLVTESEPLRMFHQSTVGLRQGQRES